MKPTNEIVLKMVLASPVGQAMSDADRDALRQTLETTDVRDVRGWLGDQIFKAASLFKGDFVGHPFRGNQHSDSSGSSTGGASGGAKGGAQGAKNLGLKVGDYSVISRDGMDYEGTVVGIKNGVVTFETANKANGEDYDDPREIDIKLSEITDIDGEKVEDTSPAAGRKRIAAIDAKLSEAKRMRERSDREVRQAEADNAGMSLKDYNADELRSFVDEQEGLLEVMEMNGEPLKSLKQQMGIIAQAKRDLKSKKTK